jgi:hypothetical protein
LIKVFPAARSAAFRKNEPTRVRPRASRRGDSPCVFVLDGYPSKSMALSTMGVVQGGEEFGFTKFR